jgi:hypothetical protein
MLQAVYSDIGTLRSTQSGTRTIGAYDATIHTGWCRYWRSKYGRKLAALKVCYQSQAPDYPCLLFLIPMTENTFSFWTLLCTHELSIINA